MRWIVTLGMALFVGTAFAQQAPAVNQTPQEAQTAKAETVAAPTSKAEQEQPTIESRKDKVSYAFGVDLGRDLKRQKEDLNVDLLIRALTDSLAGKDLLMTDEEVTSTLKTVEMEQKQDFDHARMMIAQKNRRAVEAFVAENVKKEGVVTLPSGLQYKVLKQGDGKMPAVDDTIVCQYTGTL